MANYIDLREYMVYIYFGYHLNFQFRANVKENMLGKNQIMAYAYGYRANYPIENGIRAKRSEVYDTIEELISQ